MQSTYEHDCINIAPAVMHIYHYWMEERHEHNNILNNYAVIFYLDSKNNSQLIVSFKMRIRSTT